MLTNQQIYNKVKKHLLKQNIQSISDDFGCAYRSEEDNKVLKCSIGCLIPDKVYCSEVEGLSIARLKSWFKRQYGNIEYDLLAQILYESNIDLSDRETLDLLEELQNVHDVFRPHLWKERLEVIAKRHNLKP